MPNSAKRVTREARFEKMRAGHLMKSIWAKKFPPSALKKIRVVSKLDTQDDERGKSPPMPTDHSSHRADGSQQPSNSVEDGPENLDTAENLAEAMPPATGSSSATEASLAPATSSTTSFLLPPDRPWKKVFENLRIMKLGEPGRLALLASTYSSAESRSRLTKPGEPEMSWEEVKAAIRESPPLKRKLSSNVEETEEPPRPAKMSRFEERTARVNVYDLPKNPFTTYHPTKPRRTHAFPTDDEEELHRQKKRRYYGPSSIFEPSRTPLTGDTISPILRPVKLAPFDAKGDKSPQQEPKEAKRSVPLNCQMPSVPKPEVESSLRPEQAVASKISVPIKESKPSVPKVQVERSPPRLAVTSAIEPSSQPPHGSKISIPESPPSPAAANTDKEGDITLLSLKNLPKSQTPARNYLQLARRRARRSKDQRLVKAMTESRRLAKELGPIKHTGTRPPPSIHNDDSNNDDEDKKKYSPPDYTGDQNEPSHATIEKVIQGGNEARRRAGFWTAGKEVVQAQKGEIKKEREVLIKMRKRFLRALPGKGSPLKRSESESESES